MEETDKKHDRKDTNDSRKEGEDDAISMVMNFGSRGSDMKIVECEEGRIKCEVERQTHDVDRGSQGPTQINNGIMKGGRVNFQDNICISGVQHTESGTNNLSDRSNSMHDVNRNENVENSVHDENECEWNRNYIIQKLC
jgi:hypothetical protein